MHVRSERSVDAAVTQIETDHGRIDVLLHDVGHVVVGPAEAFTPEQLAELYGVNVRSTQRVNRAALPGMRHRGEGPVVWASSSSVKGRVPVPSRRDAVRRGRQAGWVSLVSAASNRRSVCVAVTSDTALVIRITAVRDAARIRRCGGGGASSAWARAATFPSAPPSAPTTAR
ncbi:short chain dehydrogenase [mine drainage metagenome]|uniref:Short chain dehydrogenase n=1 Tax=mine drainage metagenome TaxID=410659 RepID=A0A1J5QSN6_9ZZZZ